MRNLIEFVMWLAMVFGAFVGYTVSIALWTGWATWKAWIMAGVIVIAIQHIGASAQQEATDAKTTGN